MTYSPEEHAIQAAQSIYRSNANTAKCGDDR